jgi:SSS family solute:Na+ symporter
MIFLALIIYGTILLVIAVSSYRKIKGYSDFFVARNRGSFLFVTGSLLATILGGSAIIGAIDAGVQMGRATTWFMLCAALGLFALLPLVKKIKKLGRFTLPELLEDLFDNRIKKIASVVIPLAWLGIVAAQVIASARILESFTGLNYSAGVVVSGMIFILYTMAGGQISVLKTDLLQAVLILSGLLALSFLAFNYQPAENIRQTTLSFPFNPNFKPFDLFILILTYSTTFTAGPDIYSRVFCAKNEGTAKKSLLTTALLLIPIAVMIGYLSAFGAKHISLPPGGSMLVELSDNLLPAWAVPLIAITFLSVVLSSADTTLLSASIILTDQIEKGNFGKRSLKLTRVMILVIGAISIAIALKFNSIIELLLIALTIYSGAFFFPLMAGLTGLFIKRKFLSSAIITGGIVALSGKLTAIYFSSQTGNLIIVAAFLINLLLLLLGIKKPRKTRL